MRTRVNTEIISDSILELTKKFTSGNKFLDYFLQSDDALNDGIGKTFVWVWVHSFEFLCTE